MQSSNGSPTPPRLCLRSRLNNWGPFSCFFVSLLWEKEQSTTREEPANNYTGWQRQLRRKGRMANIGSERARWGLIEEGKAELQHTSSAAASVQRMTALPSLRLEYSWQQDFSFKCKMKEDYQRHKGAF